MAIPGYDDETLMAFADGELDDERSAEIEAALGADPGLADRVAALAGARALVRELHAPLADLPVPKELEARVAAMAAGKPAGATVTNLASRRRTSRSTLWPMAMAASVAALVAGPLGFLLQPGAERGEAVAVAEPLPAALSAVLDRLASGASETLAGGARIEAIASFRDPAGGLCREFEIERDAALVAVACRSGDDWRVAFAVSAPSDGGYAPASSMDALDAYLDAVSAGPPLSPEEEAAALRAFGE